MTGSATAVMLLSSILSWVGIFFLGRFLIRRLREHHENLARVSDPVVRGGYEVAFARVTTPNGDNVIEHLEYSVILPGDLAGLHIIDGDARRFRTEVSFPREHIEGAYEVGSGDSAFDGLFDLTRPVAEATHQRLADPEVRRLLLDLRTAFGGLWVDGGRVRVVEQGKEAQQIELNIDFLVSILSQLEPLSQATEQVPANLEEVAEQGHW